MLNTRVIPCLLLSNHGLVKTQKFKDEKYVGDPINAVKIFNDKEVDELLFLDITASKKNSRPDFKVISEIASECFMPLAYGGGIKTLEDIRQILSLGVEKVCINSFALENPSFVKDAAHRFGNQSLIVSLDVKKNLFGKHEVYKNNGTKNTKLDPVRLAVQMEQMGAGEILLTSIDREGSMKGYDIELLKKVSASVTIPVIANGGAGKLEDFMDAVKIGGASAVSAGSMFVFYGVHRAVLINYPAIADLKRIFNK